MFIPLKRELLPDVTLDIHLRYDAAYRLEWLHDADFGRLKKPGDIDLRNLTKTLNIFVF